MRQSKDQRILRYEMVRFAHKHGVKPAARAFHTTPKTVRKWLSRWQPGSLQGLSDRSRAPKHPRSRITPRQRQRVIDLKGQLPSWGADRLRKDYRLAISEKSIRRIWRQEGLIRRKRRKHVTKRSLRAIKAQWRLFEQVDLDTKDLDDIPELYPQIRRHRLPLIQYTARDVTSGLMFVAYAQERSLVCATHFAKMLLAHLARYAAPVDIGRWQTDNGSEFIGSWNARCDSAFTQVVDNGAGRTHNLIPPGAHTWQADVETVHRLIEDEFYEVERFHSRADFLAKATAYNWWFNVARHNSGKENQTPWQIIHQRDPNICPRIAAWKPVFLDDLAYAPRKPIPQRGDDVIPYPFSLLFSSMTERRMPSPAAQEQPPGIQSSTVFPS
jgi:transposase